MVSSNDVQRLFLQAVLSRKVVSQKLAVKIWKKCVDAVTAADETLEIPFSDSRVAWDGFVTKINDSLNPLDLEFAATHDQDTGDEIYAIVNRRGDEVAQIATDYSPAEIAFFKAVVEQIMLAPNESFCVSSLAALREVNTLKQTMTKAQAEILLGSLVAKGWLDKSKKGRYSLSQRTLVELPAYLKSEYPDEICECTICLDIITRGVRCSTAQCKTRMHTYCYNRYKRNGQTCPTCNNHWQPQPVGEEAWRDGQDKGKRRAKQRDSEDRSEDEDEEEEAEPPSQRQSQPSQAKQNGKGKGKAKGKRKAVASDEEMEEEDEEEEDSPPPRTQKRKGRR